MAVPSVVDIASAEPMSTICHGIEEPIRTLDVVCDLDALFPDWLLDASGNVNRSALCYKTLRVLSYGTR